MVAKLCRDVVEMEKKLDDETIQHEQSELILSEVKELWENEKRALQQLTEEVCTKYNVQNMGTCFVFSSTTFFFFFPPFYLDLSYTCS